MEGFSLESSTDIEVLIILYSKETQPRGSPIGLAKLGWEAGTNISNGSGISCFHGVEIRDS